MFAFHCCHSHAIMINSQIAKSWALSLSIAPQLLNDAITPHSVRVKNHTHRTYDLARNDIASKMPVQCEALLVNLNLLLRSRP